MKYKLLNIILLGILKRYIPVTRAYNAALAEFCATTGIMMCMDRVRIRWFSGLLINSLGIKYNKLSVELSGITVALKWWQLLKTASIAQSVRISIFNGACGATSGESDNSTAGKRDAINKEERFYFPDKIRRLLGSQLPHVSINNLAICLKAVRFSIGNINFNVNSFSCDVIYQGVKIGISGVRRSTASRTLICAKAVPLISSNVNFGRASIILAISRNSLPANSGIHLRCYFKEVFLQHQVLHDEAIIIRSLFLNLQISFSGRAMEISDDSFIKVDNWATFFCFKGDLEADEGQGTFASDISSICFHPLFGQILDPVIISTGLSGGITVCGSFNCSLRNRKIGNLNIRTIENTIRMSNQSLFDTLAPGSPSGIAGESAGFLKMDELPDVHINTLVLCEDPNFFVHKGIDLYYMAAALSKNIKHKKIVRGASTITMQLVRNLFLHKRRNISRKINEIIISLLMENYSSISKNRILEVYINIIEFGPDIYGITNASRYYFSKHPQDLTVPEFITLTYIIPRPIHFHDALIRKTEQLVTNLSQYFDSVCLKLMLNKLIAPDEYKSFERRIEFSNNLGCINFNN